MEGTTKSNDQKTKLLEMMSRQFNSGDIPEGNLVSEPKTSGRASRLTRKRKSGALEIGEKTPEGSLTPQASPLPQSSASPHDFTTSALKKVRKEGLENPPSPSVSPSVGRPRRGLQDRKFGGEKDSNDEATPETPEPEPPKMEETSPAPKTSPSMRGRGRGRGRPPKNLEAYYKRELEAESPVGRGRGKVRDEDADDKTLTRRLHL